MRDLLPALLLTLGAFSCSTEEAPVDDQQAKIQEKCPKIGMDLMEGDWIRVLGNAGDHTHRFRLTKRGDTYDMHYVAGGFTKVFMKGERRSSDHKFVEVMTADKKSRFEAGAASKSLLYVEPRLDSCSLRISVGSYEMKDGQEKEKPVPGFHEYLEFPPKGTFTYLPCDEPLFLDKASANKKLADKQVKDMGVADPNLQRDDSMKANAGTWSEAAKDGDAACTYDADAYFDDRPVQSLQKVAAKDVKGDARHWLLEGWDVPTPGNHHFEVYRYKTCEGGERELIAVACNEAIVN